VSCVRRTCASTSGPTRTPACGGEPRTPGGLPRPQATCVPDLSTRAEGYHAPVCPRSRAPRGPGSRLTAPAHPRTAMLERSLAREYSFSHTAGIPRRRRARGSIFPQRHTHGAPASHVDACPSVHTGARANTCSLGHVPTAPAGTQHTTSTAHAPYGACATQPAHHTAGAPHRRRATPLARHTAGAPHHQRATPPACHTFSAPHRQRATLPARRTACAPLRRSATPPARRTTSAPHHQRATPPASHTTGAPHRPRVCAPALSPVRPPTRVHFFLATRAPVRRFTSHRQPLAGARPRRTEPAPPSGYGFL